MSGLRIVTDVISKKIKAILSSFHRVSNEKSHKIFSDTPYLKILMKLFDVENFLLPSKIAQQLKMAIYEFYNRRSIITL